MHIQTERIYHICILSLSLSCTSLEPTLGRKSTNKLTPERIRFQLYTTVLSLLTKQGSTASHLNPLQAGRQGYLHLVNC